MQAIGIIAGRGNFPIVLAQEARAKGFTVSAICVKANTKKSIKRYVNKLDWIGIAEFKRIPEIFKKQNISKVIMAGQINPFSLFNRRVMNNPDVQDFFGNIEDRRADTVFSSFAKKIEEAGLELLNSTLFLEKYMPEAGVLTQRKPSSNEYKDIDFGFNIAKHLGSIDIGQSVCVKNGVILAVESIEGTDNAIRRAVSLARSAVVLVKTSKPKQDMRFDVPVVGAKTVKILPKGSCLAIEAKKTLFLDQEEALKLADKKNIVIYCK